MLVGATVFAGLILIMLLGERGSNWMWANRTDAYFYCPPCDLRYPKSELRNPAELVCPRGHLTQPVPKDFPVLTVLIYTCVGFVGFALFMVATGIVRTP